MVCKVIVNLSQSLDLMIFMKMTPARALFHKTLKTSLRRLTGLCKDVFMFYETEPHMGYNTCHSSLYSATFSGTGATHRKWYAAVINVYISSIQSHT